MAATRAILFDWHGVLDRRRFRGIEELISKWKGPLDSSAVKRLWSNGFEYSRGSIDAPYFWSFTQQDFSLSDAQVDELSIYLNGFDLNEDLWRALPHLKRKYRLGILSDCPAEKTKIIYDNVDLDVFSGVTLFSSDYGFLKSDEEFFTEGLRRLGVQPRNCLFVDDSETNIKYSQNFGLKSHLFVKTEDFLKTVNGYAH